MLARRVLPNAVSVALLRVIDLARSKNSASRGLEPGHPPLDVVYAKLVETLADGDLVGD